MSAALPDAMRLVMITDGRGDPSRLRELIAAAMAGGVRAVQLREPGMSARELAELCEWLRPQLADRQGDLIVNDRADLAAAGLADGVHLGWRSLRPQQVRPFLPEGCLVGSSAHDARELEWAVQQGADYASLSPVLKTSSKPGTVPLGREKVGEFVAAARLPVLLLGGLTARRILEFSGCGAFGAAVMGAISSASDPEAAARELVLAMKQWEMSL